MRAPLLLVLSASVALADGDPFASRNQPVKHDPPKPFEYHGLGADSMSPEEVAKYAAPPIDPAISRRIQTMLDVRGAGSGLATAKGDRMVFTSRLTGTWQVWRQDGPMKFPIQLTAGEDRTVALSIAPNDKFVVVSRDVGGQENPGLYMVDLEGGPLREIVHAKKVQAFLEYVSDDSKSIYYRANDEDPTSFAIYRFDVASGQRTKVFGEKGLWAIASERPDAWLMQKELGSDHVEVYRYELATKVLTPLLGVGESEQYSATFGAGDEILVRTNKVGDFQRLYRLDGGKLAPITPEVAHDVTSFTIDHARTRIYSHTDDDGYARLAVYDAKTKQPVALPKLPDADNVSVAGVSRDGRFVQLALDGAQLPQQVVTLDWQTRKLVAWRAPMTPEVDATKFAKVVLEMFPARDGTRIPMFVRRPAHCSGVCPVIVEFHGGPEGEATAGFNATAQLYVDAGFTFVQPNVRGSLGRGKAWLHADDGPKRLAVITDIEDCAKYIRASWGTAGIAPKIGVMGGSYGGYSTLMAMTYFAGAYDAGVSNVGISNLLSFLENTAPYRRILRISEYGDPVKDHDALVELSPITHIGKIKAPLLVFQGLNDPRVPVGEAVQIHEELARRQVPSGLYIFPDEGHGSVKRGNIVLTIGHTIAFFEKHLR